MCAHSCHYLHFLETIIKESNRNQSLSLNPSVKIKFTPIPLRVQISAIVRTNTNVDGAAIERPFLRRAKWNEHNNLSRKSECRCLSLLRAEREKGDVDQNYHFFSPSFILPIAIPIAEVPTPKFLAISAIESPISLFK